MAKRTRQKIEQLLNPGHGWRCAPGFKVVVLDRGAVRFDVPQEWVVSDVPDPGGAHFTMFDKPEPDDDLRFQVSLFVLNPAIPWDRIPLDMLLTEGLQGDQEDDAERRPIGRTDPAWIRRPNLEIVWEELHFLDVAQKREAYTRACMARGSDIQLLMTMDYWVDDAARWRPAWDEIVRTMRLGQYVTDPLQGPPVYH